VDRIGIFRSSRKSTECGGWNQSGQHWVGKKRESDAVLSAAPHEHIQEQIVTDTFQTKKGGNITNQKAAPHNQMVSPYVSHKLLAAALTSDGAQILNPFVS